jgi:hypothetical protein
MLMAWCSVRVERNLNRACAVSDGQGGDEEKANYGEREREKGKKKRRD